MSPVIGGLHRKCTVDRQTSGMTDSLTYSSNAHLPLYYGWCVSESVSSCVFIPVPNLRVESRGFSQEHVSALQLMGGHLALRQLGCFFSMNNIISHFVRAWVGIFKTSHP